MNKDKYIAIQRRTPQGEYKIIRVKKKNGKIIDFIHHVIAFQGKTGEMRYRIYEQLKVYDGDDVKIYSAIHQVPKKYHNILHKLMTIFRHTIWNELYAIVDKDVVLGHIPNKDINKIIVDMYGGEIWRKC